MTSTFDCFPYSVYIKFLCFELNSFFLFQTNSRHATVRIIRRVIVRRRMVKAPAEAGAHASIALNALIPHVSCRRPMAGHSGPSAKLHTICISSLVGSLFVREDNRKPKTENTLYTLLGQGVYDKITRNCNRVATYS